MNYIQLLNLVNDDNFELSEAADIIGRDPALTISLLKMVNTMTINGGISSIRHAAAMLGQKELKKWINTAVVNELCADRPGEITRLSLLRAKLAEELAGVFGLQGRTEELFLMGLFSVLDVIMEKPMKEALGMVKVTEDIKEALVQGQGKLSPVYELILKYEKADWQDVSRQLLLREISTEVVNNAYLNALVWYKKLL